jgi:hypothetical protein
MKIQKVFFVFAVSSFALSFLGCDFIAGIFGGEDEADDPSPPPIEVSEGEFMALSHLDEKPVRDAGEVTTLAQSFMQTIVRSSGSNAVIVGAPEVLTTSIEVGFETTDSEAGIDVSPSELPFYRYTTQDAAANKTGMMG